VIQNQKKRKRENMEIFLHKSPSKNGLGM